LDSSAPDVDAQRGTSVSNAIPIVLVSCTSTAELWWAALDCGVEDILLAPLSASRLREILGNSTGLW